MEGWRPLLQDAAKRAIESRIRVTVSKAELEREAARWNKVCLLDCLLACLLPCSFGFLLACLPLLVGPLVGLSAPVTPDVQGIPHLCHGRHRKQSLHYKRCQFCPCFMLKTVLSAGQTQTQFM